MKKRLMTGILFLGVMFGITGCGEKEKEPVSFRRFRLTGRQRGRNPSEPSAETDLPGRRSRAIFLRISGEQRMCGVIRIIFGTESIKI